MKHHHINTSKIYEAFVKEPHEDDGSDPFDRGSHGWQVVLVMGYDENGFSRTVIDKESEQACLEFLNSLGLLKVN